MAKWVEVRRVFSPPNTNMKVSGLYAGDLERIVYGVTSIELRNSKNGDIKFIEQIGDQT